MTDLTRRPLARARVGSAVQSIAIQHGVIQGQSTPGAGSTFGVFAPSMGSQGLSAHADKNPKASTVHLGSAGRAQPSITTENETQ